MTEYSPPNELLPIFDPINFINPATSSTQGGGGGGSGVYLDFPLAQGQENFGAFGFQTIGQADMAFATFSAIPTCPTAILGTNNTTMANTAFVIANAGGGGVGDAVLANTQTFTGQNTFQQSVVNTKSLQMSSTLASTAPVQFIPALGAGGFNPTSQVNDAGILIGASNSPAVLNIAPWSSTASGLRLSTAGIAGDFLATVSGAIVVKGTGIKETGLNTGAGTGNYNTAVGQSALVSNTIGQSNNAFGYNALNANTTGDANNAFGDDALPSNTIGFYNCAFGQNCLNANDTGNYNVAFGFENSFFNTTGSNNTGIGYQAGNKVGIAPAGGYETNQFCTFIGSNSGTVGTGVGGLTQSTAIGANASLNASNQIVLGTSSETTYIPGNLSLSNALALPNLSTAITQILGDNTTNVATTAFVIANAGGGVGDAVLANTQTFTGVNTFSNQANITGTLTLSNAVALPNASTAITQILGDNTTNVATTAFVIANAGGGGGVYTQLYTIAHSATGSYTWTCPTSGTYTFLLCNQGGAGGASIANGGLWYGGGTGGAGGACTWTSYVVAGATMTYTISSANGIATVSLVYPAGYGTTTICSATAGGNGGGATSGGIPAVGIAGVGGSANIASGYPGTALTGQNGLPGLVNANPALDTPGISSSNFLFYNQNTSNTIPYGGGAFKGITQIPGSSAFYITSP